MRNPLTFQIESSLGAVFISLLSLFFIGLLFISIKNFGNDVDVLAASSDTRVSKLTQTERLLLKQWIEDNHVTIPEGSGYNYLLRKYPKKPWLD